MKGLDLMDDRVSTLKQLGFTDQDVQEMIRKFPNTINLSSNKIKAAFQNLLT